jgi:hypothetical protein
LFSFLSSFHFPLSLYGWKNMFFACPSPLASYPCMGHCFAQHTCALNRHPLGVQALLRDTRQEQQTSAGWAQRGVVGLVLIAYSFPSSNREPWAAGRPLEH